MTRDEVLSQYDPIRAGIRHVLDLATKACSAADLNRAVKQIAPWAETVEAITDKGVEMMADIALFEPNQRGRRAYNRFLEQKAQELAAADRALAQSMANA